MSAFRRWRARREVVAAALALRDQPYFDITGGPKYRALGSAVDRLRA